MTTLDKPWHLREPSLEHLRWFENLVDLHQMTRDWIKDLGEEPRRFPYRLKRVMSPRAEETLELLDRITESQVPPALEESLDDSYPEEMLHRLEQTVWVSQAWIVKEVFEKTSEEEWAALFGSLEQRSWSRGRHSVRKNWPNHIGKDTPLQEILFAAQSCSVSGYPKSPYLLAERSTQNDVRISMLQCPHHSAHGEVRNYADLICKLHAAWLRGFIHEFDPRILMEYFPRASAKEWCGIRWRRLVS